MPFRYAMAAAFAIAFTATGGRRFWLSFAIQGV